MADFPRIPLCIPHLVGNTQAYINECLETNFVSSVGPFVGRFETEFAAYVGSSHAVACVNGTAAIHVALRLLDIGPEDEVWVSDFTFIASVNPIMYQQAKPVFIDAERKSWNLDPMLVVDAIKQRVRVGIPLPKAIEIVHILGHPVDIAPIMEICDRYKIPVLEDAAESLGATYTDGPYKGKHVGTIGAIGCYSFNGNKIITTGGGGMIVTENPEWARRAKHLTTQTRLPGPEYRHDEIGYNYRLTNMAAALGVAQLEQLPRFLEKKRSIAARYTRELGELPGLTMPPSAPWAAPTFWLFSVLVDPQEFGMDRKQLYTELQSRNIDTRPIWSPMHEAPMFSDFPRIYEAPAFSNQLFEQGLSLPCSVGLTDEEQSRVIEAVRAIASA